MKKHHHFERRNTKLILVSALAAAVCVFPSCAEQGELPSLPTATTEDAYVTELEETSALPTSVTDAFVTTEVTTATESVEETMESAEVTMETEKPAPVIRTEKTEERERIPYQTVYEYSELYYSDTRIVRQNGKNGELLRVTVTTYEDGVALDVSATETVLVKPIDKIIVVGTRRPLSYERKTVTEDVIPYETEIIYDDTRYDDERTVLQTGNNGYTLSLYLITYEKGVEISRELISAEVVEPQNEIVSMGTKPAFTEENVVERGNTIPYKTEYVYDNTLAEGTRFVKTKGKDGYTENVYTVKYYRGELSSKELSGSNVYEPTAEIIVIGTKKEESYGLPYVAGRGYPITQSYGNGHYAMDIGVWYGDPILAVKSGTVIYAYDEGDFPMSDANWTYGTFVVIEHEDGVRSYYAHLKSRTVSVGQRVSGGQTIGYSGNTGRVNPPVTASNPYAGTHLHFEIRVKRNGSYVKVDPTKYIDFS